MRALFLLLLFLVGCENAGFKHSGESQSEPSALGQAFSNLFHRAMELSNGDLFQDFSPESVILIEQIHTDRFIAFVTELQKDTRTQNSLIKLKNELLGFETTNTGLNPVEQADFFEKTANNSEALKILLQIRNDLYGSDGKLFKKILLGAAHDPIKRQALIAGQLLGLGLGNPEKIKTIFSDSPYALDLIVFSQSKLKQNLDAFSALTGQEGKLIEDEFMWTALRLIDLADYASLSWVHQAIQDLTQEKLKEYLLAAADYLKASDKSKINQLVSDLMPELRAFAHALVESLTGKSWANLDQKDLQNLLDRFCKFTTQYLPNQPGLSPEFAPEESADEPITRTHIRRLDVFVKELIKDSESQLNLIEVKNIFLSPQKKHDWSGLDWAKFIETIAANPQATQLLLDIRDDLYGPDGQLLKKILLSAAHHQTERAAFVAGQAYNKCLKENHWYPCLPWGLIQGNHSDKILFSKTQLNKNLERLQEITELNGSLQEEDKLVWACIKLLPILSYSSLAWLHEDIRKIDAKTLESYLLLISKYLRDSKPGQTETLLSGFGSQIHETGHALFASFTGKSLKNLTPEELHELLERLDAFLGPH